MFGTVKYQDEILTLGATLAKLIVAIDRISALRLLNMANPIATWHRHPRLGSDIAYHIGC